MLQSLTQPIRRFYLLPVVFAALLTAVSGRVVIPLPFTPIPITLQVLAVILAGLVLGSRLGAASQLLYLGAILVGAPLSAAGIGGPAAFMTPTVGYLIGFVPAAYVAGWFVERRGGAEQAGIGTMFLSAISAVAVIYCLGAGMLAFFTGSLLLAFTQGVLPFIGLDLLKAALAAGVARGGRTLLLPH